MALYPRTFPDEDLCPLVTALPDGRQPVLSLAVLTHGGLAGHIAFAFCGTVSQVALLAPPPSGPLLLPAVWLPPALWHA